MNETGLTQRLASEKGDRLASASFGTFGMASQRGGEGDGTVPDVVAPSPSDVAGKNEDDNIGTSSDESEAEKPQRRASGSNDRTGITEEWDNIANLSTLRAEYLRRTGEEQQQSKARAVLETVGYGLKASVLDYKAILVVFLRYLVSLDTLLYMLIATGFTLFYYYYRDGALASGDISWTFVSFAIIFPISFSIAEAYRRREQGLRELAQFKSLVTSTYMAHAHWDFGKDSTNWGWRNRTRGGQWEAHTMHVRTVLCDLVRHVRDFLLLPCVNNLRYMHTNSGRREKNRVMRLWRAEIAHIELCFSRLSLATEILKAYGLPGNEAARINQYLMLMQARFSAVRYIKGYRTAQGVQSYARLFIFLHPLLYGSYYAYLGRQINLGWALAFSYLLGFSMIGLVNVELSLEDPFQPNGLDRIRIDKIAKELCRDLRSEPINRQSIIDENVDLFNAEFTLLE